MEGPNLGLLVVGLLVMLLGLLSEPLKRSVVSAPLVALSLGVLLGPAGTGAVAFVAEGGGVRILEQVARITVALSLVGIALRLPRGYPLRNARPLAVLLGPLMVAMWLASGLLVHGLIGLGLWSAMAVGAVVTPTDPVVASSIVTGGLAERNIPERVRHLLSAESGANDALAYPLVLLSLLLMERPAAEALPEWLLRVLGWEVVAAAVVGGIAGYGAGRLLEYAESRRSIERVSYLAYTLALTFAVLGGARLLGTDGLLAVFVAGLGFSRAVRESERADEERVQEAVNSFFTLPAFVLLGLALPWAAWRELGGSGLALAGAVLLLRRLPALLALSPWIAGVRSWGDALFLGWFGPIGIAALFYASLVLRESGMEEAWAVGSLLVAGSVLVHGVSAAPLTRLYGRAGRRSRSRASLERA